ncbi:hypothetical protein AVEN_242206-1 [Araneus ventricosus]|uniref:Histone-lysine N-methyltransferase SETMAR n=1 Tax=Araneus ventricosus TaxID=182803 RepID=A0A4Y2C096_ARAVE|nr:hypothetical protein AVEN_242206-1 [Araneus ventricosus]
MLPPSANCIVLFAFFRQKAGLWKTIDAAVSYQNLRRLRRVLMISGIIFIHSNDRLHSAVVTQQLLKQFKWDVSVRPAYNPDLAPRDFHLFPQLKNWLGGQSFQKITGGNVLRRGDRKPGAPI